MYFADTLVGMHAHDFDIETGAIENRRLFARIGDASLGVGGASAIGADGFIRNARRDGGCLIRWAPDGAIDRTPSVPCQQVTSAACGGDDLGVLYVTSARSLLSEQETREQPLAGGIFALDPGVRGRPEVPFAG